MVEVKGGHKAVTERRFFPGYVLVEMEMTDETWHLVKNTAKVTGFVGGARNRPTPISPKEVEKIMSQMQEGVEKPRPKTLFEVGEMVRVKEGPFTDFNGTVEEVNYEKSRVRVSVTIFGRSTRSNSSSVRSKSLIPIRWAASAAHLRLRSASWPLRSVSSPWRKRVITHRTPSGVPMRFTNGKEDYRLYQAADPCR